MTHSKNDLRLARVALLESRMATELAALIRKYGGRPVCAPSVREQPRDAATEVATLIDALQRRSVDFVILQTGVSVDELARTAHRLGREAEFIEGLRSSVTVCRGPKPVAALRRLGMTPALIAPSPHTTGELLSTLAACPLDGANVVVVHHGERHAVLASFLRSRCSEVSELVVYDWELPTDTHPLQRVVRDLVGGRFDAVAFTSQVQVRHLFVIADRIGLTDSLTAALRNEVVTAAVGPTCAAELRRRGIPPTVTPVNPKMGHMVLAMADYFSAHPLREGAVPVAQ